MSNIVALGPANLEKEIVDLKKTVAAAFRLRSHAGQRLRLLT